LAQPVLDMNRMRFALYANRARQIYWKPRPATRAAILAESSQASIRRLWAPIVFCHRQEAALPKL
jgi:hypothetical protein